MQFRLFDENTVKNRIEKMWIKNVCFKFIIISKANVIQQTNKQNKIVFFCSFALWILKIGLIVNKKVKVKGLSKYF